MKTYILRAGQTYGPYDRECIEGFLKEELVSGGDLAWTSGQEGWIPLGELLGLSSEPTFEQDSEGEQTEEQSDSELAETVARIKTLIDKKEEQFALDLLRSLNEPKLFAELLRGCSIGQDGEDQGKPRLPDWLHNEENERHDHRPFFLHLIKHCPEDAAIDDSLRSENLTHLNLSFWSSLKSVECLSGLTKLTHLNLKLCSSLKNVDALSGSPSLTHLSFMTCFPKLEGLRFLPSLTCLDLTEGYSLTNVKGLSGLSASKNLTTLNLRECSRLTNVDVLSEFTNLMHLSLAGGKSLTNLDCLSDLKGLRFLSLCECESLTNIDFLAGLTNLTELDLSWCSLLTNVDALSELTNLEILYLNNCKSLKNVDGLSGLTNLRRLFLEGTFHPVDELRTALPDCEIF